MFEWAFFLPTLVATIVGVTLGIPIGLWLNRRASEYQRHREEEQAGQRKLSVLKALQEEAAHNLDLLNQIEDQLNKNEVPFYSLDTDMWALLGGEVAQAVTSENILTRVSLLYFEFDHMKRKLDAVFQIHAYPNVAARSLGEQRFTGLCKSILLQLPPTKNLCNEVLSMLGKEVEQVVENFNARRQRRSRVGDAALATGRERLATSAVSCFLAAFLFSQARVIGAESVSPTLLNVYLAFAVFFLLDAAFLLFIALTNLWTKFGQRVEAILWLEISYTTIAGLIFSWGAGIAAISPCLFWREWFFWLGFVWIMFYCVYFIREAKERGRQFRAWQ